MRRVRARGSTSLPAETRLTAYRQLQVQNPAELVDPPRRRATIGENDVKFDTFDEYCITMSLRILIFRLICIVMTLFMPGFVENGKCTEEIYSKRNFIKVINFRVNF